MSFPSIYFKETAERGRGVFTQSKIAAEVIIETCPVILVTSAEEVNLVVCTTLINYAFRWNTEQNSIVIALGYGSLYNHSAANNAFYKMNEHNNTLDIIALKMIEPGEEITINYVGSTNISADKWFADRGIKYIK